ncbi:MAG: hypothetical protein ACOC8B_03185 [Gemmatimonadota bacterium]
MVRRRLHPAIQVADANGIAPGGASVSWASADEAVATVSAEGWAVAASNGTSSVRAVVGEITGDAAVRVEQVVASV